MRRESQVHKIWYKHWWGIILAFLVWPIFCIWFIWARTRYGRLLKTTLTAAVFVVGIIGLALLGSKLPAPTLVKNVSVTDTSHVSVVKKAPTPSITTQTVTSTEPISYGTVTQSDPNLAEGQTKTIQAGKNGVQTLTYKVTYSDGKQTNKTLVSTVTTTPPVQEIIGNGTYVAPAPAPVSTPAAPAPSSCYPLTDAGNCYEPGEYCRASDSGTTGLAGDGESITCTNNDGLRWEPS